MKRKEKTLSFFWTSSPSNSSRSLEKPQHDMKYKHLVQMIIKFNKHFVISFCLLPLTEGKNKNETWIKWLILLQKHCLHLLQTMFWYVMMTTGAIWNALNDTNDWCDGKSQRTDWVQLTNRWTDAMFGFPLSLFIWI